jgi:hypothetical protein
LTDSQFSAHTSAATNFVPEFAGAQRTETMSSMRSHTVAKASAALPFIRSCDWSRMSVTMQGPGYPSNLEGLGLEGLVLGDLVLGDLGRNHLDPTGIAARA